MLIISIFQDFLCIHTKAIFTVDEQIEFAKLLLGVRCFSLNKKQTYPGTQGGTVQIYTSEIRLLHKSHQKNVSDEKKDAYSHAMCVCWCANSH